MALPAAGEILMAYRRKIMSDCVHDEPVNASLTTAHPSIPLAPAAVREIQIRKARQSEAAYRAARLAGRTVAEARRSLGRDGLGVPPNPVRATIEKRVRAREPKGPLGLRVRLAWMRLRLWVMRARLDGRPWRMFWQPLSRSVPGGLVGYTIVAVATGTPRRWSPFPFLAIAILGVVASVGAWLLASGWRTPTLDKALEEAG